MYAVSERVFKPAIAALDTMALVLLCSDKAVK